MLATQCTPICYVQLGSKSQPCPDSPRHKLLSTKEMSKDGHQCKMHCLSGKEIKYFEQGQITLTLFLLLPVLMDRNFSAQELAALKLNLIEGDYRLPRLFHISNSKSSFGQLGQNGSSNENCLSYQKTSSRTPPF